MLPRAHMGKFLHGKVRLAQLPAQGTRGKDTRQIVEIIFFRGLHDRQSHIVNVKEVDIGCM